MRSIHGFGTFGNFVEFAQLPEFKRPTVVRRTAKIIKRMDEQTRATAAFAMAFD
jgi:hypothetical protein